ncbi:hypothetical protein HYPSUDRAFT_65584 [Hypholoma sublateritium FD-334 SS-4]|uniref:Mid2 domain-containing protein n=1 Tax=Hypholoma sublateritium (strain FD-334 SS-4) TaxID=945553 RepID=A0A0D2PY77_HYPSF|nr:hypothetical protein HYPSUDRAFT_65584 [Hypholoma sublateritium FD-334 SS-4]
MISLQDGATATIKSTFLSAHSWAPKYPYVLNTAVIVDGVTTIVDLQDHSVPRNRSGIGSPTVESSKLYTFTRTANGEHTIVVSAPSKSDSAALLDMFSFDVADISAITTTTTCASSTASSAANTPASIPSTTSADSTSTATASSTTTTQSTETTAATSNPVGLITSISTTLVTESKETESPSGSAQPDASAKKINILPIIIGAVAGVVLTVITSFIIFCCYRRRRRRLMSRMTLDMSDAPLPPVQSLQPFVLAAEVGVAGPSDYCDNLNANEKLSAPSAVPILKRNTRHTRPPSYEVPTSFQTALNDPPPLPLRRTTGLPEDALISMRLSRMASVFSVRSPPPYQVAEGNLTP